MNGKWHWLACDYRASGEAYKTCIISDAIYAERLAHIMGFGFRVDEENSKEEYDHKFETNGGYGMVSMNMPALSFPVGGKLLIIPANRVAETGIMLTGEGAEQKFPCGTRYYVLDHRCKRLYMSGKERDSLVEQLNERVKDATGIANEHTAKVNAALRASNEEHKRATGEPLPLASVQLIPAPKKDMN